MKSCSTHHTPINLAFARETALETEFFIRERKVFMAFTLMLLVMGLTQVVQAGNAEKQAAAEALYDHENIITIEITMPEDEWSGEDGLQEEEPFGGHCDDGDLILGDRYQPHPVESVTISGTNYPDAPIVKSIGDSDIADITIKKKSYCGSFSDEHPSLKLKFDFNSEDFEDDFEEEIGTRRIILHNSRQDKSFIRQCLGYDLIGLDPVMGYSRCNFAKVYINGDLYTRTYVNVEPIKKRYVKNRIDGADGNLYELEGGEDFDDDFTNAFYEENGDPLYDDSKEDWYPARIGYKGFAVDDKDAYEKQDLALAIELIEGIDDAMKDASSLDEKEALLMELEQIIDMDMFIKFWAMEAILQHNDGYNRRPGKDPTNTYIYNATDFSESGRDPENPTVDDLNFVFLLYGIDQTLVGDKDINDDDTDIWGVGEWKLYGQASAIGELLLQHPYYMGLLWDQIYEYLNSIFDPVTYTVYTEPLIDQMEATLQTIMAETGQIEDAEDAAKLSEEISHVKQMLEALHDGIDAMYGDELRLQIVYPTDIEPAQAGAFDDPGKIWVMVSGRTTDNFSTNDFEIEIGGEEANIISGQNVQNQFWMVVEAPDKSDISLGEGPGLYDLVVKDDIGDTTVTYPNAVEYAFSGIPVDTVIVGDISGSMANCGKLEAAQNAARLYLDHAGTDDRIGVVGFSTDIVDPVFDLQDATEASLQDAKAVIDGWETHNKTAIGKGILEGQSLLLDVDDSTHDWEIALLSDGKQNVAPYWDDIKDSIDNKIVIDSVALGADADLTLMNDIADATDGSIRFAAIDQCPEVDTKTFSSILPGTTSSASSMSSSVFGSTDMSGLSLELADIYKGFAEKARMEDRIGDWTGILDSIYGLDWEEYYLTLESGLPEAIFALNWDGVGTSPLMIYINDVPVEDLIEGETTLDATHVQYRLPYPAPGEYKITVVYDYDPADEVTSFYPTPYRLMVSANSKTSALTIPDSVIDSLNYNLDWDSIPVHSFVGGDTAPITGADVIAEITTPTGDVIEIPLEDNGSGLDGEADDGLYGGSFTPTEEGPYSVVIVVDGVDEEGNEFERRKPTVIVVGPESDDTSGGSSGGSTASSICVLGENTVDMRDRAVVTSNVAAGTYFEIGAPATLNGNGFVDGDALIRSYGEVIGWGVINGDLTLAGELSDQGNYTITGTLTENGTPSIPVLSIKTVDAGTGYEYLSGVQTLTPGNYGDVGIGGDAEITFNEGVYNFASLSAWNDVIFNVNGDVEINVEGNFVFGDRSTIVGGEALTVYTNASQVRIGTDVIFNGVLVAPNADVTVYSRTVFNGCIGAENLVLDTDVSLEQSGYALFESAGRNGSCFDWIQNGNETGVDCGGDCALECREISSGSELGEPCDQDADCLSNYCDQEDFSCSLEPVVPVCSEATATDLGATGTTTAVQNDGCVMVRDEYPWWWGTRTMMLQTSGAAEYPLWFTWSNPCSGNGGTEMFSTSWQNVHLYQTSDMCATVIDFQGSGSVSIDVIYYGG